MSDTQKKLKIVTSPCQLEGGVIGRVVRFIDGSGGRVETWSGDAWVPGGVRLSEFFTATRLSADQLAALELPDDAEPSDDPDA